jgi:hypothetical protein
MARWQSHHTYLLAMYTYLIGYIVHRGHFLSRCTFFQRGLS